MLPPEFVGIEVHLVLADEAAHPGHLGHAGDGAKLVAQIPVLEAAELAQIGSPACGAGFGVIEVILENPAEAGGIGTECGPNAIGHREGEGGEPFQHASAGEVGVDPVLKDNGDHGVAEVGVGAHFFDPGHALKAGGKREGDLILDLTWRASGPFGEHDDLVFAQVRDGLDGLPEHGDDAPAGDAEVGGENEEAVAEAPVNEMGDHGGD
jgi:hypothetical protein